MRLACSVLAVTVCLVLLLGGISGQSLLVSDQVYKNIAKLSLETGELETLIAKGRSAGAFEFDPIQKEIYWSDIGTEQILKSDLSGNSVTVVANISVTRELFPTEGPLPAKGRALARRAVSEFRPGAPAARVSGMALDAEARMLFYTVYDNNEIVVLHLDNGNKQSVINNTYQSMNPGNIVLDEEHKRIYWVAGPTFGISIFSANYKGTNITVEARSPSESSKRSALTQGFALTFDQENGVLYWAESSYSVTIYSLVVGSKDRRVVMFEQYGSIRNIAYFDGMLYVNSMINFTTTTFYYIPAEGGNKTYINLGEIVPTCFFIIPEDDSDTFRPEVYYELVHTGDRTSELVFHCNFSQQTGASSYRTNWFVDDSLVTTTSQGSWDNGDVIMDHVLKESQIRDAGITTFGITVTCSVEATFAADNITTSPVSSSKFIGISLTKSPSSLAEGEAGEVELTLTAPFGCGRLTPAEQCKLTIDILPNDVSTNCTAATLMPSACGAVFESATWETPVSVKLYGRITSSYGNFNKLVSLKFKIISFSFHAMWANYEISLKITLTKTSAVYQGKSCSSVNDPHLSTFDGRRYEHQYGGNFTLYKHKELPVEVEIQTANCGGGGSRPIFCNCGVAVRAGQSLYVMNRCQGQFMSRTCGDDLVVNGDRYGTEILLPTGGKVRVTGGRFINIFVYPSIRDVESTEGLCGFMSRDGRCTDDFYMRGGAYSPDPTSTDTCNAGYRVWENVLVQFSESWRVPEAENLFSLGNDLSGLSPWPSSSVFCTCPEPTGVAGSPAQPICTADQTVETCKSLGGTKPALKSECHVSTSNRRRRSTSTVRHTPIRREKRQGVPVLTWLDDWTLASAVSYCNELFGNSSSIQACDGVAGVSNRIGIETCLVDIFLTGTTDYGQYAVDEVVTKCLHEIVSDPQLSQAPAGGQSVFDVISAKVCPGDCSGTGTCTNGACVCQTNYGGSDCSIDLTIAPDLAVVGDNGLCDTNTENCDVISALGETFVDDGTKCKFDQIKVNADGQEVVGVSSVDAITQSVIHLRCERPPVTGDNSDSVIAYLVSVANPGGVYSEKLGLMVYDSRCVEPTVNGTTFSWTFRGPGYCLHQGVCYKDNDEHPSRECTKCNRETSTWERERGCGRTRRRRVVLIVVSAGLFGVVVVGVVVYWIFSS